MQSCAYCLKRPLLATLASEARELFVCKAKRADWRKAAQANTANAGDGAHVDAVADDAAHGDDHVDACLDVDVDVEFDGC